VSDAAEVRKKEKRKKGRKKERKKERKKKRVCSWPPLDVKFG